MKKSRKGVILALALGVLGPTAILLVLSPRAKARAEFIQCANNLCAIGFATRTYAMDYTNALPADLRQMSNELTTPKILLCPRDKRAAPLSWSNFSTQKITYEYLAAGIEHDAADTITNALFRCPIHGHVVYGDGRIVRGDGKVQYGKYPASVVR